MKTTYPTEISVGKILDPKKAVKSLNLSSRDHYISKPILIENFLLLTTQSRTAALFYIDNEKQHKEAAKTAKDLGLGFKIKTATRLHPFIDGFAVKLDRAFTFSDDKKIDEIENLHPTLDPEYINLRLDVLSQFSPIFHKKVSSILEYDSCCVSTFTRDMYSMVNPDERIFRQVALYREKNREVNPDSFYVREFIPCKPNCENAAAKGRKFENDLRNQIDDAVADVYRGIKLDHLKDVELGKIFKKCDSATRRYGMISGFDVF